MFNINILSLFLKASFLVQFVILILIWFSVISWAIIIRQSKILNMAIQKVKIFEKRFWSGIELLCLYKEYQARCSTLIGIEQIFYSAFKEFARLRQTNLHTLEKVVNAISRFMRVLINRELGSLEEHIPFLGTIGSISPYIGLFGTVLGIMHAFISLGSAKHITLQMIAPGIAEALITTAIGLFTAIPAIMAFNQLNQQINKLEQSYDNFMEEFLTILHFQDFTHKK